MYRLQTSDNIKKLLHSGRKLNLPKGQIVQSTDDRRVFNLIEAGYIKRYLIANDGSLGVQVLYGPGDFFPITLAFSAIFDQTLNESPETYYYEAITPITIYTIDEANLRESAEKNPLLYKDLLAISGKRLHSTLHGLENLTLSNSYRRVAHEIYNLGLRFGEKKSIGTIIKLQLTHQDIADILSVTRETVSTCMVQLRQKKLISTDKSHITIKDMEKLKDEAYS